MEYIACISYGKDSLYMLEIIKRENLPLDRIVTVEIMATPTIDADLPPMVNFKKQADIIIKERYGFEVQHLKAKKSYEEYFYSKYTERSSQCGKIYGFPMMKGAWCNNRLKVSIMNKLKGVQYIGIGADEPNRFHNLSEIKRSPLVEYNITEKECYDWRKENNLLSPIYEKSTRGGCWFCHNQAKGQLRNLREDYPEYWELMLKWDNDSPVTFKPDGTTLHDINHNFELEDAQMTIFDFIREKKDEL